ncbi:hypothetical protein BJY52DRAFT_1229115 [Lactarius psammicola]|nr:hypothetical protein BJY52DRAFT_1229115 [Lactarius psammicola]
MYALIPQFSLWCIRRPFSSYCKIFSVLLPLCYLYLTTVYFVTYMSMCIQWPYRTIFPRIDVICGLPCVVKCILPNMATTLCVSLDAYTCLIHTITSTLTLTSMPKPKEEKNVTKWSCVDKATLVHTLAEQKTKGNWGDNNPKKSVWTACEIALAGSEKVSGGSAKAQPAIKSRWQCLKQEFDIVKKLRGLSGFGWDDAQQM